MGTANCANEREGGRSREWLTLELREAVNEAMGGFGALPLDELLEQAHDAGFLVEVRPVLSYGRLGAVEADEYSAAVGHVEDLVHDGYVPRQERKVWGRGESAGIAMLRALLDAVERRREAGGRTDQADRADRGGDGDSEALAGGE